MQGHHKNSRYHLKDMVTNPAVMFLKYFVSIQKRKKLTFIGPSGFVISEHSRNSLHRKRKHSISHPGPETPYYLLLLHLCTKTSVLAFISASSTPIMHYIKTARGPTFLNYM